MTPVDALTVMVLDASAVVEWLLGSERGDAVVTQLLDDPDGAFFAPDLLDVEVVQAFRRLRSSGGWVDWRPGRLRRRSRPAQCT